MRRAPPGAEHGASSGDAAQSDFEVGLSRDLSSAASAGALLPRYLTVRAQEDRHGAQERCHRWITRCSDRRLAQSGLPSTGGLEIPSHLQNRSAQRHASPIVPPFPFHRPLSSTDPSLLHPDSATSQPPCFSSPLDLVSAGRRREERNKVVGTWKKGREEEQGGTLDGSGGRFDRGGSMKKG